MKIKEIKKEIEKLEIERNDFYVLGFCKTAENMQNDIKKLKKQLKNRYLTYFLLFVICIGICIGICFIFC